MLWPVDRWNPGPFRLELIGGSDVFEFRVKDAFPDISGMLQMRIEKFAHHIVREAFAELASKVGRANEENQ